MASGEQFGPANIEVMQDWVTKGRVPDDCWVWRTGWPEWKPGNQAIAFLNRLDAPAMPLPPDLPSPPNLPAESGSLPAARELPGNIAPGALPTPTSTTAQYLNAKRNRQDRARKVTFFLGGFVLLLLAVLVVMWMKN
jgi:hypothetical protein